MSEQDRTSPRMDFDDLLSNAPGGEKGDHSSTRDDIECQFDMFPGGQEPLEKKQQPPANKPTEEPALLGDLSTINFSQPNFNEDLLEIAEEQSNGMRDYAKFLAGRVIEIQEPQTINENFLTSYKLYTIRSRASGSAQFDTVVRRRFSDFEFLQNQLLLQYGGCILPVLPEKNFWACLNLEGSEYVKLRVKRLMKYLTTLMANPSIRTSRELKLFLFVDSNDFSEQKGQFEEKVRVEDRVYSFLQSAVETGQSFLSGLFNRQQQTPAVMQSASILSLTEYEVSISGAYKSVACWRRQMELRKRQYTCLQTISGLLDKKGTHNKPITHSKFESLEQQFQVPTNYIQDLADFVESCRQALNRRNTLAVDLQNLKLVQQTTLKKNKNNPRSKEVDMVKTKIKKSQEMLERWTTSLLEDIAKAAHRVKQLLGGFVRNYLQYRSSQYSL